ncbi:hypothetical protein ES703_33915 [subsurface metagenome]
MIRLEQIRLLESKVNKAVELIKVLREENQALKKTLDSSQNRMQELEKMVEEFKSDQDEIEQYILKALKNLDHLEDELTDSAAHKENIPESPKEIKDSEASSRNHTLPLENTGEQEAKESRELEIF